MFSPYLKHISSFVGPNRGATARTGLVAAIPADGGVCGRAGEVVEVDGGGEHHRALPLHGGQHVRLPREPGPQLGAAPVLLLAAVAAAVLVRVGRLQ